MAFSHTVTKSIQGNGVNKSLSSTYSGSSGTNIQETIAIGTDTLVNVAIDVSAIKSLYICSDVAMTLETNSSSAPDDTISLIAGVPLEWQAGVSYYACPLTVDVTKVYLTNVAQAAFELYVIQDSTP